MNSACVKLSAKLLASSGPVVRIAKTGVTAQLHRRHLTLHCFQSQSLLKEYGVPIPEGFVAQSGDEVYDAMKKINHPCILKAQLQNPKLDNACFENGFRAGSYHPVHTLDKVRAAAKGVLGQRIPAGKNGSLGDRDVIVDKVYVSRRMPFDDQWYLAMTIDRERYGPVVRVGRHGKEEVVRSIGFSISQGITSSLVADVASVVGASSQQIPHLDRVLRGLFQLFTERDALMVEAAPVAVSSEDGTLICLDSRVTVDDSAARRQPELFGLRDTAHEVGDEVEAEKFNLVYVRLDGNVGNVVNGAGLALATNDAIGLHGGSSANFMDAGGRATTETMKHALGIVLRDERVRSIFINIYGGITRCDMIAESIIGAAQEMELSVPIVVRLQGTNSAEGLKLLAGADLGLHVESDFGLAAQKAVELAGPFSILPTTKVPFAQ